MNTNPNSKSAFVTARTLLGVILCLAGISIGTFSVSARSGNKKATTRQRDAAVSSQSVGPKSAPVPDATMPTSGTLTSANIGSNNAINYADTTGSLVPNLTFLAGNGTCAVPMSCSTFTLTIDSSVGTASAGYDPTKYQVFIEVAWATGTEDYDTWMCSGSGNCVQANVVASNTSTADPEVIILPTNVTPGAYTINLVNTSGAAEPYTGTIFLKQIPVQTACTGNCAPPRYQNYPAGAGQAEPSGEPSIGVDWNPNVASLKDTTSPDFTTGTKRLNTGGVVFFKGGTGAAPIGDGNWRVNFDDCSSPAVNVWDDVSATFDQQFVLTDPIGFVDHYSSAPLGISYPPPHTTGRVFTIDLIGGQGNSQGAFSDNDGNSYTPGANGGPGQGPDHETLGGGPYNPNSVPPPPPQVIAYGSAASPNAIYYCSQSEAEAECSRSDDGGQTFGPGVIIYNPATCTGGIHGHVKVAPDGTVYVPNSSCGQNGGTSGVAMSIDNGLTWTEGNVFGSSSTQDPSVGIGQNGVGKPGGNLNGTNTVYIGYVDGDGHPKIAHSGDRGAHWSMPVDVGTTVGVTHAVFPVTVAGDDNRAAFGFLGTGDAITTPGSTGTCNVYGAAVNCSNIWHLYIATTYDGGADWITIDATPNDPIQKGVICLQGTTCPSPPVAPNTRNLLDFNDFSIDAEGRGVLGYDDGCVNCDNDYSHGGQSGDSHGTVARQSGGRRLFAAFDPIEPMPPASPQLVSAVRQGTNVLVTWLEPDSGGSPITGYNIYRSTTSGSESFLTSVSGNTNTKYLDTAAPSGSVFYYVKAVNGPVAGTMYTGGEGNHCGEVSVSAPTQSPCIVPGVTVVQNSRPAADDMQAIHHILSTSVAYPFTSTSNPDKLVFTIKVQSLATPLTPNSFYYTTFTIDGAAPAAGTVHGVRMIVDATGMSATFESYVADAGGASTYDGRFVVAGSSKPALAGSNFTPDGTITIIVSPSDVGVPATDGTHKLTNWNGAVALTAGGVITAIADGMPSTGGTPIATINRGGSDFTVQSNQACRPNLPPVAVLTATPTSGFPGLVVHFDGSGSFDPDTAPPADTIVNYHFIFDDGTTADCPGNAACTGTGKIDHTYTSAGDYTATLTVTESRGGLTSSPAQAVITVNSNSIQPVKVVSRMMHGSITPPFEVTLPLTGRRGVECRSSSALGAGNYQMVFEFVNPLTSVGSASVTTGTGSVSGSAIGLNKNEYIVNLTGVTNAQYVAVTLANVHDSVGNSGNVIGPQMGVLVGDTNADGFTDAVDTSQTKSQSGNSVQNANFREDVNVDGFIDAVDTALVKSKSGTALPSQP
jgi:hypothetical protein